MSRLLTNNNHHHNNNFNMKLNFIVFLCFIFFNCVQNVSLRAIGANNNNNNSSSSNSDSLNSNTTINILELDEALDALIQRLYGDFDLLGPQGIWEPRFSSHSSHTGSDNALHFSNEWLVHIGQGDLFADQVANETGYFNLGQVKGFPKIYRFIKIDHPEEHHRHARQLTQQLESDERVTWADQQCSKKRTKRDFSSITKMLGDFDLSNFLSGWTSKVEEKAKMIQFNDPLWYKEWYMQDTRTKPTLPRLDLNVVPVFGMGYTGKGLKVVILDDGLEHNHTDLISNYNPEISGDLNDNDDDPMPVYNKKPPNSHGTRCAGEIAMIANNSKCGVGIAYGAQIGGVRMLDGPVSDRIEGQSLSFAVDKVDIYSASWGPSDDGETVEGPGRLAQRAFLKGVTQGRNGKGVIYVWASGNGGANDDCCSCDGYASNIYTLSIGSASESGVFPWYGEKCPSTMAVTYSSGAYTDQKIATTDILNTCTTGHTGTSASAPLAAGIVALTLEANPHLTYRDIQHLVAWTAEPGPLLDNPGWKVNGAGYQFNSRFGFGLMDATGMVKSALNWTKTVPPLRICRVSALPLSDKTMTGESLKLVRFISRSCQGTESEINFLEHVELLTTVQFSLRGALEINLTSPAGTNTNLLFPRKKDVSATGFTAWPFVSVHTWGENPHGTWTMSLADVTKDKTNRGFINGVELILYGTKEEPAYRQGGLRQYPKYYKKSSVGKRRDLHEMDKMQQQQQRHKVEVDRLEAILNDNFELKYDLYDRNF